MVVANTQGLPAEVSPVASRLYRTTRPLYLQVTRALDRLGIATIASPTTAALIALSVTGLILLDARPTQTRLARFLPGRCHDALNRLLRTSPLSTRSLLGLLVAWVARSGVPGYLCLDDVVVEKAFAKRLRWAGWTYSFAKKRKVYGMHVVVVLWCSADGGLQDPGGVPAVAAQAVLRARRLPDQAAAGRADAHRAGRRPAALPVSGHGHPLHRRLVYPPGRSARDLLGRDPATQDHGHLARPPPVSCRAGRAAAAGLASTAGVTRGRRHGLRTQVRPAAVGRDQKPSRQPGAGGHQRPGR